ncbi:DUF423 domain-containing protein [Aeromonas caviae]|jgi:uncharacterized membrane protein YgdD (TMEM256/DUF423 family)|uniref:DUF423 domain-containing protein n=2 Tax=Aeromonas caviae TaxID=648 RepID=A0A081LRZ3_AERCA|nr:MULTISPECIES: DUF423 domain-containing protein [Aeromonas]MCR6554516.1 DUF423 domain-containing protein [Aeromonas sp. CPF2-S1]PZR02124.1 MAG: DUF423 domain-containing protein [Aeromonas media]TXH95635.1 MAG: DUF423 domain-containing protein [Pseudorhodobacter sp.]AUT43791.1 DUF423 domain-containing protein [Aeromonas sp. ASNIH5]AUU21920.1 DUF423 domain-containing protein [Aeromonas caviae]
MQIQRHWLVLAGFFGLTATMLGAYGAHGLAATGIAPSLLAAFNTAVQYQFFHALALLVLGLCGVRGKVITFAGAVFVLGILGFSGSIYAMVLLGSKGLGLITPAGGLCFMLGWAALMWAGCRLGGKNE